MAIDDVTVDEAAGTASFTVSLSAPSAATVTVDVASSDGTATAPDDYRRWSASTLSFLPRRDQPDAGGDHRRRRLLEGTENFTLTLSKTVGTTIADADGQADCGRRAADVVDR